MRKIVESETLTSITHEIAWRVEERLRKAIGSEGFILSQEELAEIRAVVRKIALAHKIEDQPSHLIK